MRNRDDLVQCARSYLGVRWLHQGRSRLGLDCVGLLVLVARDMGLSDYDTVDYGRRTVGQEFLRHFRRNMDERPVAAAESGDVLLFRDSKYSCHSSIVGRNADGLTIIHSHMLKHRVVEESLTQGDWMLRRVACFAFLGLDD